ADVVGGEVLEALGAVAALQQEGLARRDLGQRALELARLAGKHQRRIAAQARLGPADRLGVRVDRHLLGRLAAPAGERPVASARPIGGTRAARLCLGGSARRALDRGHLTPPETARSLAGWSGPAARGS